MRPAFRIRLLTPLCAPAQLSFEIAFQACCDAPPLVRPSFGVEAPWIEPIVHMVQRTHRQRIFRITMLARWQRRRHLDTAPKASAILLFHEQVSLFPMSHASGFHLCDDNMNFAERAGCEPGCLGMLQSLMRPCKIGPLQPCAVRVASTPPLCKIHNFLSLLNKVSSCRPLCGRPIQRRISCCRSGPSRHSPIR